MALNAVVQAAGYLMVVVQVAALVRYPDGRRVYVVEDWLLRGMLLLTPLLPVVLLVTRPEVVPAWVVQYAGADGLLVPPSVESPWYVPAVGWLGPSADVVQGSLIAVGPVLGAVVAAARYVRMGAADRQRMAWPLLAVLVFVLGIGLSVVAEESGLPRWLHEGMAIASYMVFPIAMGIGIAAPQLFDALGTARRTLLLPRPLGARAGRVCRGGRRTGRDRGWGRPQRRRGRGRGRGTGPGTGAPHAGAAASSGWRSGGR